MRRLALITLAAALTAVGYAAFAETGQAAEADIDARAQRAAHSALDIDTAAADTVAVSINTASIDTVNNAAAAGIDAANADTALSRADSLKKINAGRRGFYSVGQTAPFDPSKHTPTGIFRSDGASLSDVLRYRALTAMPIPFSLSSGMNRLLPYGNPAPVGYPATDFEPAAHILPYSARFFGNDMLPVSNVADITVGADPSSYIAPPASQIPCPMASPELSVFWENGVFSENILNLRLSRPLGQKLMFGAFANYRYLEGQRFSHNGNGVMDFYRSLYADTSEIMNSGYNPHTDERAMGVSLTQTGADSSKLYASFSYLNMQNEYALNNATQALDRLEWAALDRRVYRVNAAMAGKPIGPLRADVKAALISERVKSSYLPDSAAANGKGGAASFIVDADFTLPIGLGLSVESAVKNTDFFDGDEGAFSEHHAEIFYRYSIALEPITANLYAHGGIAAYLGADTLYTQNFWNDYSDAAKTDTLVGAIHAAPKGGASVELLSSGDNMRLNVFADLKPYAVYPDYAPPRYTIPGYNVSDRGVLRNSNLLLGAEGQLRAQSCGALLGYQYTAKEDLYLLRSLWPEGFPPYKQPRHTTIIAPWIDNIRGLSLMSRAIITDTRPFVKATASASYLIKPAGMEHTFEPTLSFDYWSEGELFFFGGFYGWNEPIYDLNLKITAHIKTFRMFFKMDNVLNRKLAYVPGYFSPGVTFRWGIEWFLQ
jgi:hypothetical protein